MLSSTKMEQPNALSTTLGALFFTACPHADTQRKDIVQKGGNV